MSLRAISYGGGVQSTALLVLAATGRIDFPLFLMANVGDDSENPATLAYVRDVAAPYAADHGIELVVLDRVKRDGTTETLYQRLLADNRSIDIPVRMPNGAPGNRGCTADFKIAVIARDLKARGATASSPATVGIGISLDEIHRANRNVERPDQRIVYPLVGIGEETDLRLTRNDCGRVIREAGLPVPPKSSCYFCPFHTPAAWADLRREQPDLFDKSADLEERLNRKRAGLDRHPVWLSRFGIPLRDAIDDTPTLFDDDGDGSCDTGYCWT